VTSSFLEVSQPSRPQPLSFGALRSPAVANFTIPSYSLQQQEQNDDNEIMSPTKTTFDIPWPREYDSEPKSLMLPSRAQGFGAPPTLMSPRSTEFHMTGMKQDGIDESFGLLSPRAATFDLGPSPQSLTFGHGISSFEPSDIASPIATQFPKDIFGKADDTDEDDLASPRAEEFHMSPFKPEVTVDEDPFGMTSPTRFEFGNPFDKSSMTTTHDDEFDDRRPSFQAILPPSHQTFNGFASLDGAAQAPATFPAPLVLRTFDVKPTMASLPRIDSLSASDTHVDHFTKNQLPTIDTLSKTPERPQTPKEAFLSAPAKGIRTRFSSPNLRQQRKLHKLQTEIESKLPRKSPVTQHSVDDIDALMSPRAEEFTRNPFHFNLQAPAEDASPASSNETIKDGRNGHTWDDPLPRQWTPEKATVDPRSPVQTGSSPIVRNIWDVL
jgi:tyrosine-protein phosphatase